MTVTHTQAHFDPSIYPPYMHYNYNIYPRNGPLIILYFKFHLHYSGFYTVAIFPHKTGPSTGRPQSRCRPAKYFNESNWVLEKKKKKNTHTNYKQVLLCSRTFTNLSWKPLPQSINTAHLHTFAAVWRDTVSAGGHCNLHNSRGCHHSPVMIIMESNTSVLCWGKNSAGHHLCSLLNLIQNTQSTLRRRSQETV